MMDWYLVTGGPCADIGKGSLSAALVRRISRSGLRAGYQKLEPCLQRGLAEVPNGAIGEIIRLSDGRLVDFDVARVCFFAPETALGPQPDLSLWGCLSLSGKEPIPPAPVLVPELADGLVGCLPNCDSLVIELGGSLGEAEHRLFLTALLHGLGRPRAHLVVGACVRAPGGRVTTKPLQTAIASSPLPADAILVRGAGESELNTLRQAFGAQMPICPVGETDQPVAAFLAALDATGMELPAELTSDPVRCAATHEGAILLLGDRLDSRRFESLAIRIETWSGGRLGLEDETKKTGKEIRGVVVVAEVVPEGVLPTLRLTEQRDSTRADWKGSADAATGPLMDFVSVCLESRAKAPLAYTEEQFARQYLAQSRAGQLRDHGVLDPLVSRCLPVGIWLESSRILDVGCGDGRWAVRLVADGAAEVVGLEPSLPMAAAAAARGLPRFRVVSCGIEDSFPAGPYDVALASMSLDHVDDLGAALRAIARQLAPGGRLVATTEHPWRTAAGSNRWRAHPNDPARRQGLVECYRDEGPRSFHWFGRPEPVVVLHRSIETWVRLIREAGLDILAIDEPAVESPRDGGVPRFWLLCAEKPGPRQQIVTIDGPAGAGKTTLGRSLAMRLGWLFLDSGAFRRAFAWRSIHGRPDDPVSVVIANGEAAPSVGGRVLGTVLEEEEIGQAAATLCPELIRQADALYWETLSEPVVTTGRAIGRCVRSPRLRVWLEVSLAERAARRNCEQSDLDARDRADIESRRLLPPDVDTLILDAREATLTALCDRVMDRLEPFS
jgi:cytidylate kinase/SAM-dependent methyltransferase